MYAQSPGATEKEIKQAYYRVMRACHPDVAVSLDEEDDGEAGEVCVFVNDIYEVRAGAACMRRPHPQHALVAASRSVCRVHADPDGCREAGGVRCHCRLLRRRCQSLL